MNLFFVLFLISIAFYFAATICSLLSANPKIKISDFAITVLSVIASGIMLAATMVEAIVYQFAEIEYTFLGDLFYPVSLSLKMDNLSTVFLLISSVSAIVISVYIYVSSMKREIGVSHYKSSFLANLFMIVLALMICANQSYFVLLLIECAVVLLFIMQVSDFNNEVASKKAIGYLIAGNAAVILMILGYALVLSGSGLFTIHGVEAALMSYFPRNIAFVMIMGGFIVLVGLIPETTHSHVRLLSNGLFSKILLFLLFRYVVNLFSGTISIITILILLACALAVAAIFSVRASMETNGFRWLRYSDIALNAMCFIAVLFSLYADNLGYALIAEQIRNSTSVMILCSIVIYPAVTILIQSLQNVDKSKRFKGIALAIFVPKSLLPPIGGFAGIFIIISNISSLLDLHQLAKSIFLFASIFGLVYVYLFYIYAHMKFYINVVDAGYEPKVSEEKRKISKLNLGIVAFSVLLTFVAGMVPAVSGYGISILYTGKSILMLACNVLIMLLLVYLLQFSQVNTSFHKLAITDFKQSLAKNGIYHTFLKLCSFVALLVAGTFFSVSGNFIVDGISSYAVLGVMYIVVSIFMLYDKDIDFQDLYYELFMMLALIVDAVTPRVVIVDIIMAIIGVFLIAFAIYRQRVKIRDTYDRILANGKIYLYIAFFLTYYATIQWPFNGFWDYVASAVSGIIFFALVYVVASFICLYVFQKKGRRVEKK